jgi:hypothetical protein
MATNNKRIIPNPDTPTGRAARNAAWLLGTGWAGYTQPYMYNPQVRGLVSFAKEQAQFSKEAARFAPAGVEPFSAKRLLRDIAERQAELKVEKMGGKAAARTAEELAMRPARRIAQDVAEKYTEKTVARALKNIGGRKLLRVIPVGKAGRIITPTGIAATGVQIGAEMYRAGEYNVPRPDKADSYFASVVNELIEKFRTGKAKDQWGNEIAVSEAGIARLRLLGQLLQDSGMQKQDGLLVLGLSKSIEIAFGGTLTSKERFALAKARTGYIAAHPEIEFLNGLMDSKKDADGKNVSEPRGLSLGDKEFAYTTNNMLGNLLGGWSSIAYAVRRIRGERPEDIYRDRGYAVGEGDPRYFTSTTPDIAVKDMVNLPDYDQINYANDKVTEYAYSKTHAAIEFLMSDDAKGKAIMRKVTKGNYRDIATIMRYVSGGDAVQLTAGFTPGGGLAFYGGLGDDAKVYKNECRKLGILQDASRRFYSEHKIDDAMSEQMTVAHEKANEEWNKRYAKDGPELKEAFLNAVQQAGGELTEQQNEAFNNAFTRASYRREINAMIAKMRGEVLAKRATEKGLGDSTAALIKNAVMSNPAYADDIDSRLSAYETVPLQNEMDEQNNFLTYVNALRDKIADKNLMNYLATYGNDESLAALLDPRYKDSVIADMKMYNAAKEALDRYTIEKDNMGRIMSITHFEGDRGNRHIYNLSSTMHGALTRIRNKLSDQHTIPPSLRLMHETDAVRNYAISQLTPEQKQDMRAQAGFRVLGPNRMTWTSHGILPSLRNNMEYARSIGRRIAEHPDPNARTYYLESLREEAPPEFYRVAMDEYKNPTTPADTYNMFPQVNRRITPTNVTPGP